MTSRIRSAVMAVLTAAAALTGVLATAPAASAATPNIVRVPSPPAPLSSSSVKSARAQCPAGMKVIGGGGEVIVGAVPVQPEKIVLTNLFPFSIPGREEYVAQAEEAGGGTTGDWTVRAFAMCSDPLPGLHIVRANTAFDSEPVKEAIAHCPSHQRAIGSGARVRATNLGQVYLRVARTSGPGDIVRSQGHEAPGGYDGGWEAMAYAVCADTPPGYHVQFTPSVTSGSQSFKSAKADCPAGLRRYSTGIAASHAAPANIGISSVQPLSSGESAVAIAMEVSPTSASWDTIIATLVCAE